MLRTRRLTVKQRLAIALYRLFSQHRQLALSLSTAADRSGLQTKLSVLEKAILKLEAFRSQGQREELFFLYSDSDEEFDEDIEFPIEGCEEPLFSDCEAEAKRILQHLTIADAYINDSKVYESLAERCLVEKTRKKMIEHIEKARNLKNEASISAEVRKYFDEKIEEIEKKLEVF